tara:strand:+ start:526 stop:822 length:297 start_codon:yes stop_codon:yes gene_type:complete
MEQANGDEKMTRGEILDLAKSYVVKDRADTHGDMENNFETIAAYWGYHLDMHLEATDVAVMMNLLKCARIKSNVKHPDNWVDAAGYMACGGEIAAKIK